MMLTKDTKNSNDKSLNVTTGGIYLFIFLQRNEKTIIVFSSDPYNDVSISLPKMKKFLGNNEILSLINLFVYFFFSLCF
jgi:hypothetical protein